MNIVLLSGGSGQRLWPLSNEIRSKQFAKYNTLKKISFDYAVVEHEPLIEVMRFSGTWKDLGTWNTLTEAMDSNNVGEKKTLISLEWKKVTAIYPAAMYEIKMV